MKYNLIFVALLIAGIFHVSFSQNNNCAITPKILPSDNKTLPRDEILIAEKLMKENQQIIGLNKGSIVFTIFFNQSSASKIKKSKKMLIDMLNKQYQNLSTNIPTFFQVQESEGSVYFKNGDETLPIIHLSVLVYSDDSTALQEIFSTTKSGTRINLKESSTRKVKYEVTKFTDFNNDKTGYMYLLSVKLDRGDSCDPDEDIGLLRFIKPVFDEKYTKNCLASIDEVLPNAPNNQPDISLISDLQNELSRLRTDTMKLSQQLKFYQKEPQSLCYAAFNVLTGDVSLRSSFSNSAVKFHGSGVSSVIGFNRIIKPISKGRIFITSVLGWDAASYFMSSKISSTYTEQKNGFVAISSLNDYQENLTSRGVTLNMGLGYQHPVTTSWSLQVNGGLVVGGNRLSSDGGNGLVDYQRSYPELPGIMVENQSSLGLANHVVLQGVPAHVTKTALTFGYYSNIKINYAFAPNSPLKGFIQLGFIAARTKTSNNNSRFISTEMGEFNSILNSISNVPSVPFQFGVGISCEIRKVPKPTKA